MTYVWTDPQASGLLYPQLCDDLSFLFAALAALQTGPTPATYVPTFGVSADGTSLTVTVNGSLVASIPIPVGGSFGGPYVAGSAYVPSTLLTSGGSAYIVAKAFTASTLASDLTAGNVRLFAAAGAPAINRTGPYVATQPYNVGDGVTTTNSAGLVTQWVLSVAAPAGTAPAAGSTYWSLVAGPSLIDSTLVNDATYGLLSAALKTLTTNVAAALAAGVLAQKQAAAINVALGNAKVTSFPITLPTS